MALGVTSRAARSGATTRPAPTGNHRRHGVFSSRPWFFVHLGTGTPATVWDRQETSGDAGNRSAGRARREPGGTPPAPWLLARCRARQPRPRAARRHRPDLADVRRPAPAPRRGPRRRRAAPVVLARARRGRRSRPARREPDRDPGPWLVGGSEAGLDEISSDNMSIIAAGCGFYALFALFPAITALLSIYGLVVDPGTVERQLGAIAGVVPQEAFRSSRTRPTRSRAAGARRSAGAPRSPSCWHSTAPPRACRPSSRRSTSPTRKRRPAASSASTRRHSFSPWRLWSACRSGSR